jgi:23S rRNA (guanosine2251-2'-O)-methyltransferase
VHKAPRGRGEPTPRVFGQGRGGVARSGRSHSNVGVEFVYGRNPVLEALRAGRPIFRLLMTPTGHGQVVEEVRGFARLNQVPVSFVDSQYLDALLGEDRNHQGVAAEAEPFRYTALQDALASAMSRSEQPLILVLDALQDPQNFGTLLRTALATAVHGVVIPEHRAVAVTPAVSRASAGAVEHLAVARVTNLVRSLKELKDRGVWVYGLDVKATQPFWEADWRGPAALVVGAEGRGLGRLVRENCDALMKIPTAPGAVQSLNAATAGSLVLYEAFRVRSIQLRAQTSDATGAR